MKYLVIFLFLLPCFVYAQDFPDKPSNYITDETNSITSEDQAKLNSKLRSFEDSTSNQIFVYVAYSLNGQNLEQYSEDIFHHWKIGQGEKNNGVLIAIFVDDHKFRIQTGYGLEGALPDLLTKRIQDNDMRPLFKLNRYYEGIDKGVDQLIYYSKHEYVPADEDSGWGVLVFFYVFSALFLLITILLARKIKDRPTAKKVLIIIGCILFIIPVIGTFLLLIFIFVTVSFRKDLLKPSPSYGSGAAWGSDSSSSWSSSDSSYSSGGSDFGGGGGGDSGGGGSSSDW